MKRFKLRSKRSHRFNEKYGLELITHVVCMVLSVVLTLDTMTFLVLGQLAAAVVSAFFCALFMVMAFRLRRLKLKVGPFEAEVQFR